MSLDYDVDIGISRALLGRLLDDEIGMPPPDHFPLLLLSGEALESIIDSLCAESRRVRASEDHTNIRADAWQQLLEVSPSVGLECLRRHGRPAVVHPRRLIWILERRAADPIPPLHITCVPPGDLESMAAVRLLYPSLARFYAPDGPIASLGLTLVPETVGSLASLLTPLLPRLTSLRARCREAHGLQGPGIVDLIAQATALVKLELSELHFLPDEPGLGPLSALTSLTELRLAGIGVSDVGPLRELKGLEALEIRDFPRLKSSGLRPALSACTGLTALTLASLASLNHSALETVAWLKRLRSLSLAGTPYDLGKASASSDPVGGLWLSSASIPLLAPLNDAGLVRLSLTQWALGAPGLAALATALPGIRALDLTGCALSDVALGALSRLSKLEEANLSRVEGLTGAGLACFSNAPLRSLTLQHCQKLEPGFASHLLPLAHCLEALDLAHSAPRVDVLRDVTGLSRLKRLNLDGCWDVLRAPEELWTGLTVLRRLRRLEVWFGIEAIWRGVRVGSRLGEQAIMGALCAALPRLEAS